MSERSLTARLPKVGFIGLGRMGAPMAANVAAAGYPLILWNRSSEKAVALAQRVSATVAATLADVASQCDVVITMLADGAALEEIYFGDPEFVRGLAGGLAVDMSTIGPAYAKAISERLSRADVRFVEAPVSGSTPAAEAGTLTILAGAEEADFDAVRALLEAIGDPVLHLGGVGAASLMKLAINSLIYGINQCLAEALVLAERGGVDAALAYDAILESAAAAPVVSYRQAAFLDPDGTPVSFALNLEEKDLRLTLDLAEELGSPMPQTNLNRAVVADAIAAGFGDRDIAAVVQYLRGFRSNEDATT
jgi:3-hydroxyisobutyrate dehydrogenase-like beta-hydroxyacid dehydrogenase